MPPTKSKNISTLSTLLIILTIISIPSAFSAVFIILTLSIGMMSVPGTLIFSFVKVMPYFPVIAIPGVLTFLMVLYTAVRIRTGSPQAWKTVLILIFLVLFINIISGFLTNYLVGPIYKATAQF